MKVWPLLLVDGTLLVVILRVDSQVDAEGASGFCCGELRGTMSLL